MQNNTQKDYKEAIRIKFEKEKDGVYSNYLYNPSQANLRELCWKIFSSNPNTDDLKVYYDFFKSEFDPNEEDTSITYTDKFKKVGDFLKRKKEPAKIDTVNLAAILVDFELRPYQKFYHKVGIVSDKEITIECLVSSELVVKKEQLLEVLSEVKEVKPARVNTPINLFISFKKKCCETLLKKSKGTIISVALIFCLISAVIYFAFFKKDCMQWSGDHYERVDCNLKVEGFVQLNSVEPFDESKFELKKINLSDTTTCFKNGEAIIWYAKTANGVDFFNTHGRHPENDNPLRPVTQYILNKYGKH
nr:hypothetical protein [uncultured Flavobacterium sp.]